MEGQMCDKFKSSPDACVKGNLRRYAHNEAELVKVTGEEAKMRVCFVDETRPKPY